MVGGRRLLQVFRVSYAVALDSFDVERLLLHACAARAGIQKQVHFSIRRLLVKETCLAGEAESSSKGL